MAFIEFRNVSKYYNVNDEKKYVISDFNLELKKGEFVVIKGVSGSGKSLILNFLASFEKPSEGKIFFNRKNIVKFSGNKITDYRRKNIGFADEKCDLIEDLTVLENIILAVNLVTKSIDAESYIKRLKLADKLNYYPHQLSDSDKMKVVLLRALCKSPKILLCDEIFNKMESKDKKDSIKLIKSIIRKEKILVLASCSDNLLSPIANRVVILKNGTINKIIENKKPKAVGDVKW